jgi:hypothetical protein
MQTIAARKEPGVPRAKQVAKGSLPSRICPHDASWSLNLPRCTKLQWKAESRTFSTEIAVYHPFRRTSKVNYARCM